MRVAWQIAELALAAHEGLVAGAGAKEEAAAARKARADALAVRTHA